MKPKHSLHVFTLSYPPCLLVALLAAGLFNPVARAEIQINQNSNSVAIAWSFSNAVLHQADEPTGPWVPVTGATSPYLVTGAQGRKFYRLLITGPMDNPRTRDVPPLPAVEAAVADFKRGDPDASFSFFNGHVDNFATRPKNTVPSYAANILASLNLPTATREHILLAAPVFDPKPSRNLDADPAVALPTLPEADGSQPVSSGNLDVSDPPSTTLPPEETRSQRHPEPETLIPWTRPSAATLALEARAASPILANFLTQHRSVFEVEPDEFNTALMQTDYQVGAFFRKAVFAQSLNGKPLVDGRTLVLFDANWNILNISRMITTPSKLAVEPLNTTSLSQAQAVSIASAQAPGRECAGAPLREVRAELGVDHIRRLHVWDIELLSDDTECHWRTTIDANRGTVLNVTDLRQFGYTDAKVNRWYYPGGNIFDPHQTVSPNIYTRNDRRLEHDFFWVMNDHRCDGDPESLCSSITEFTEQTCAKAYGTTAGSSTIRATVRTDRDFSHYYPGGASEAFGETHMYYWARQYCQWLKPALDALGVLPDSASDFPRVLIIVQQCRTRARATGGYKVTTQGDKGEGGDAILIPHRNPSGPERHNDTCEGGACYDAPSNIGHELNHFFLSRYFGYASGTDCAKSFEHSMTHEGILGTAVPQAFWNWYYGVGYNPSTDHLYFSDSTVGLVHKDEASRMLAETYSCSWAVSNDDPYSAGRVAGQVLWEIYHGKKVTGSTLGNMGRPANDTAFNCLVYWAADLHNSSTVQDRYEYANRFMEILDKYCLWPLSVRQDYYNAFQHHSLHWSINNDYWH